MKIILEGCDGVGKSTVANKLKEKLGYEIVKGTSFEIATASNEELYNHCKSIAEKDNIIVDRYIFSNIVYATLFPQYTILTENQFKSIDWLLKEMDDNIITLYLYANIETLKERIRVRGDEHIDEDKLGEISSLYDLVIEDGKSEPYFLDTSIFTSDDIVEFTMNIIQSRKVEDSNES